MTVKKLYVVGSGAMGSGIAQTAATHGIQVIMNDINEEFVAKGYNKIKKSLENAVTKGRMTEEAKEEALANLTTTVSLEDAKDADFVIEAASENKEIKLGIFEAVQTRSASRKRSSLPIHLPCRSQKSRQQQEDQDRGDRYSLLQPGTCYEAAGDRYGSADIRNDLPVCFGSGRAAGKSAGKGDRQGRFHRKQTDRSIYQ